MTKPVTFLNFFHLKTSLLIFTYPYNLMLFSTLNQSANTFSNVDLPAPELPIIAKHSPLFAYPVMFLRT